MSRYIAYFYPDTFFCTRLPSSLQKVLCTPPICITIRLPVVSRYFFRSIRVRNCWKLNLRTGTGWRAVFQMFLDSLVHKIFLEELCKITHTGDFSPIKIFGGTRYWYANFSSLGVVGTSKLLALSIKSV